MIRSFPPLHVLRLVDQMNGNQLPDLHSLDAQLRHIKTLRTLYLEANPCQTSDRTGYRRKVMLALPQLTQIDAT
jgi:protein phosphatase 1 regulatory subunit 7